jgi:hypothetical protein
MALSAFTDKTRPPTDDELRVTLGARAVAATAAMRLAADLREAIAAAPRYAEGRGVRVTVTRATQVAGLAALAEIKSRH